jgi:plastocyanin
MPGRYIRFTFVVVTWSLIAACSSTQPVSPTPDPGEVPIANVYILPGAVDLGANAFGDHPISIHRGERMRWRNADAVAHTLVPDTGALPEFVTIGPLAPGEERSFIMATSGMTTFRCADHPQMTGTLIVQDR